MSESVNGERLRRFIGAWSSVLGNTLILPLYPTAPRLRRIMSAERAMRSKLPPVRIESIVGEDFDDTTVLTLKAIAHRDHNCTIYELATLGLIAKCAQPKRAFEIGTFDGRSALAIASNMPPGGQLYTLNLPPDYGADKPDGTLRYDERLAKKVESGHRFKQHAEAARIHQLFGNSVSFDFSPYGPSQMIFIDGGHGESVVIADTDSAMKFIDRSNGVILWHDSTDFGVRPVLERMAAQGRRVHLIAGTSLGILWFKGGQEVAFPY